MLSVTSHILFGTKYLVWQRCFTQNKMSLRLHNLQCACFEGSTSIVNYNIQLVLMCLIYDNSTTFSPKTLPAAADRISKENAVMQLEMGSPYLAHGSKCKKGSYSFFKRRNLTPRRAALYNNTIIHTATLPSIILLHKFVFRFVSKF